MSATYPYSSKDRLVAADLNLDLELNPGAVPPASAFGGAHIYKQWIDTSVTPPVLRMCVANPASSTYNAPDWIALATIDSTNKHFGIASVILSDTAPPSPLPGLLWWDSVGGNLYVSYFDGNSTQWVPATNTSGLPVPITIPNGGTGAATAAAGLSNLGGAPIASPTFSGTVTIPASANIAQPHIAGVTDGSNAAAGQVGEYLTASGSVNLPNGVVASIVSLTLSPGDWDVMGTGVIAPSGGNSDNSQLGLSLNTTSLGSGVASCAGPAVIQFSGMVGPLRQNITTATTIYLTALASFSAGTVSGSGTITARRMR